MPRNDFRYANSETCKTGIMICANCGRVIKGEYRYRETRDKFINVHRSCCENDPEWARREATAAAARMREDEIGRDIDALLKKHGIDIDLLRALIDD